MQCTKCGTENAVDSKYCRKCGSPLTSDADQTVESVSGTSGFDSQNPKVNMPKIPMKVCVGTVVVVVGIFLLVMIWKFTSNSVQTINMNDYLIFEFSGTDGIGNASVKIDWDTIENKYGNKIKLNSEGKKKFGKQIKKEDCFQILRVNVSCYCDQQDYLTNGEVIDYYWFINDMPRYLNVELVAEPGNFTVSGLNEAEVYDAFEDLAVQFSGLSSNGRASVTYNGKLLSQDDFYWDSDRYYSNGDEITVYISSDSERSLLINHDKKLKSLEKTYVVEGLEEYVTKLEEIDDAAMEALKEQAICEYKAKMANTNNGDEAKEELVLPCKYCGCYFLTRKQGMDGDANRLYLVFELTIHNQYKTYDKYNTLYWAAGFSNLTNQPGVGTKYNLKMKYLSVWDSVFFDSGISRGTWFIRTLKWEYLGYESLADLRKALDVELVSYYCEDGMNAGNEDTESVEQETDKQETDATSTNADDYIFPNSDKEKLTAKQVSGKTKDELCLARNELYARHGRLFDDEDLQDYFNSKSWYQNLKKISAKEFEDEKYLSEIEMYNRDLIKSYE